MPRNQLFHQNQSFMENLVSKLFSFKSIVLFSLLFLKNSNVNAQTFPPGFSQIPVTTGFTNPTAMAFAPDGRIFICEQGGALKIVKNGSLLPTSFLTLTVNSSGERGLLGIAFDPNFTSNSYLYLYYTSPNPAVHNRVSRFTANGDVVMANSELEILNLNNLSGATNHNGGNIQFGPDGKLYVAVGDNANSGNAQLITNRLGKILRINSDGTIPIDNPTMFPGIAGSTTGENTAIWSVGLRNPYTIGFQPGTGKLFVNDVGQSAWEEINDNTLGGINFGWPGTEGTFNATTFPNFVNPVYAYGHAGGTIGQGCAITGGTFFNPTSSNYGIEYQGNYFFLDYCGNWIDRLVLSPPVTLNGAKVNADVWTRSNFASNISGLAVGLTTGPDGNLYYLSRSSGGLVKITSNAVLPIKVTSFIAKSVDNQSVELNWATSNETNFNSFEIQNSANLNEWENIGIVKADPIKTEIKQYNYTHFFPNNGLNYYRLKLIDLDGKFEYSNINTVTIEQNKLKLFPNPSQNLIELAGESIDYESIEVYNIMGKIENHKITIDKKTIDISGLASGKYFIKTKEKIIPFVKY